MPLALMALESRGMMKDRVYGVTKTMFHGPCYLRHVVSAARVRTIVGGTVSAEATYAVFRTRPGGVSEVYNVGPYIVVLVCADRRFKFKSRLAVHPGRL